MYAIEVQSTFCAAHALHLPRGGTENLHGHNFHVTVKLTCQKLDGMQAVVDFHDVENLLEQILVPWHNQHLNMLEPFKSRINPSAERIAEQIGLQMQSALGTLPDAPVAARGLRLAEVRVTESAHCLAIWAP